MGILDAKNRYSSKQALSGAGAAPSTDTIDHTIQKNNLGIGEPMVVQINVDVAADGADADETYVAALEVDALVAFGSVEKIGEVVIPRGSVAGSKFYINIPPDKRYERHSRLNYTLGGTTPSVTLSAFLIPLSHVQNEEVYPDNITIS